MEALEEHKKDTRQRLVMIKSRVNEMHLDFWKKYRTPSALWDEPRFIIARQHGQVLDAIC
jgi:hypothetical protein